MARGGVGWGGGEGGGTGVRMHLPEEITETVTMGNIIGLLNRAYDMLFQPYFTLRLALATEQLLSCHASWK